VQGNFLLGAPSIVMRPHKNIVWIDVMAAQSPPHRLRMFQIILLLFQALHVLSEPRAQPAAGAHGTAGKREQIA
jgi:5'(3')-deoxyribonucleotidase